MLSSTGGDFGGRWIDEGFDEDAAVHRGGRFHSQQVEDGGGEVGVAAGEDVGHAFLEIGAGSDEGVVHVVPAEAAMGALTGAARAAVGNHQAGQAGAALVLTPPERDDDVGWVGSEIGRAHV